MLFYLKILSLVLFQLIVIVSIVLLFSGHFNLQSRHEQLQADFDRHWHYTPKDIPDFMFGKAKIFSDEKVPYFLLTVPKRKNSDRSFNTYFYSYRYKCEIK